MIPRGADHYWESGIDPVDHRDDPPPDDHEISDERAEQWARERASHTTMTPSSRRWWRCTVRSPLCHTVRRAIVREARRRKLPVWAFLLLLEVTHD